MEPRSVILDRGISLRLEGERWFLLGTPASVHPGFESLPAATAGLAPHRAILVAHRFSLREAAIPMLLRADGHSYYGLGITAVRNRRLGATTLYPVLNLAYLLEGVSYHCIRLASLYAAIALEYSRLQQTPGMANPGEVGIYGGQSEAYHEFEALVSVVRRGYDMTRYLLWPRFGKGSMPRSLEALLETSVELPDLLRERLIRSWTEHGRTLTDYRDCIQHYVPLDSQMGAALMRRHAMGAWTCTMRIPDNPEARSSSKFSFALDRDALDYSWGLAEEILETITAVVEATVPATDA